MTGLTWVTEMTEMTGATGLSGVTQVTQVLAGVTWVLGNRNDVKKRPEKKRKERYVRRKRYDDCHIRLDICHNHHNHWLCKKLSRV